MKVNGSATLNAPADRVWAALNDPAVLVRTVPGCEQLEPVGPDAYRMTITAGVASIKGTYLGDVRLTDPLPPSAFTLEASGAGAPGTVSATVRVTLADQGDGTTLLNYAADAVVGGPVGGVGQRVLSGVAKRTASEFFRAVDGVLDDAAPAAAPTADAGPQAGSQAAPATFRRPGTDRRGKRGSGQDSGWAAGHVQPELRSQLAAVLLGATMALAGVWVGWRIGRRG